MGRISTASGPAHIASRAVFGVFATVGVVFASWMSRLPAIRDALGLTPGQMGMVLLVGSAGSLVALPLTGSVVHRFGSRRTTRMAALLSTAGFVAASVGLSAGSTTLVAACLFIALMGVGAWDVSMNLQGTVVEHELGRAIMPRFHAGFSLGAVAGAALGALAAAAGLPVPWHIVASVSVALVAVLILTRQYLPDGEMSAGVRSAGDDSARDDSARDDQGPHSAGQRGSALAAWTEPRTLLIGLMVLAAGLTEGSANDWLALSVVDGFSTSDAVGALAFGTFVASMTAMRFAGTRLLDRFGRVPVLRLSAALALVGLLVFALAPSLPLALVAIVLWGAGAAMGFPVGMSAAADDPSRSTARVSVVSSIGYISFLAGPPVLGMLADHVGYRMALLTIAGPLVMSLILSPVAAPLPAAQGGTAPGRPT